MIKLTDLLQEKKIKNLSDEDRLNMYLKYYKNLSPKGFKVKKDGKKIVITIL